MIGKERLLLEKSPIQVKDTAIQFIVVYTATPGRLIHTQIPLYKWYSAPAEATYCAILRANTFTHTQLKYLFVLS